MYQTPIPTPPRVLVADDQSDILQALRMLLVDAGLDTELVNSVEGIRDRVGKAPFDLLLMDLNYTRDTTSGKEGLDVISGAPMRGSSRGTSGQAADAERVGVMIADVAGKGLPAALLMSNLQAAVRAFASEDATPQQVATSVNRLLCRNIAVGKFVSFCYMVVDRARGTLTFANAGHNPPLLVRGPHGSSAGGAGQPERLLSGGLVLGVMADSSYDQHELAIAPGDRLILYTDGIIEAEDGAGVDYGETRLGQLAAAHSALGPQPLLDAIFADVSAFAGGQFSDDATLIVVAID